MAAVLSDSELATGLSTLRGWSGNTSAISRRIEAPSFLDGIALVDRVAQVAEQRDHHPDIDIRWRTVTFTLSTHSDGGVTARDLELAAEIDALTAAL